MPKTTNSIRPSSRRPEDLRKITFTRNVAKNAEGSCLIKFGKTHVFCTASIEERVPPWLRNTGQGWVTAEYGMLPRSTNSRMRRESTAGKQSGRTQEIQRLIGRSLRSVVDLKALGENQIILDCDVIQADGGTRTAAISGSFVALYDAMLEMLKNNKIQKLPITDLVAAVSCGIFKGMPIIDLDYHEDSNAETDANFVLTSKGKIIEIQATAESSPFAEKEFQKLLKLAKKGVFEITQMQKKVLGI